ncbi:hypothetical protein OsI_09632 [Oryza sativa Indica Group]|uniref:Uncharacterized protein n=1 Tax=Oryza sativa subsp. indica TaxID=39946 RepID=A2XBH5_ORYSI|nr:hypothetical protein OsI_09632 [Oryza sativa Indica Group]
MADAVQRPGTALLDRATVARPSEGAVRSGSGGVLPCGGSSARPCDSEAAGGAAHDGAAGRGPGGAAGTFYPLPPSKCIPYLLSRRCGTTN